MQNNFRKFEELVFCDLWFPDSGFRFRIPVRDSGFLVLGLPFDISKQAKFVSLRPQLGTVLAPVSYRSSRRCRQRKRLLLKVLP